uniref:Uncharacterized protein n=1 Tax=uncultured prokaryote TaxID=198431 RepID=A0A0H5Q500_9ZZZZ|nr:hypothetical protein [uncultured prokaryote]
MSIALVPVVTLTPGVKDPLSLVVLAERWGRSRAERDHLIGQGAGMEAMRVVDKRVEVQRRALDAALARAVPGYDPGDLRDAVDVV